jgi:Putative Ig domain/WD40-like Beta Propeller Repeat
VHSFEKIDNHMKKLTLLSVIVWLGMCSILKAQGNFWDSPKAYLGQTLPGNDPVKFAPQLINDSPFFSMDRSAFSVDGKEFYYCRNNTWFSIKDASIQVYRYDGAQWTGPTTVVRQLFAPAFAPGGDTLYMAAGGAAVTQIHRDSKGWSAPEIYLNRSYGMYDFMPTASGNMYAASNIHGSINDYTCYDISLMPPVTSGDTSIHTLGKPLNTPGFDGDFFVAPDESYIVVSAKEHPDYECELYISYHKPDGTWTNPKSLGPRINNGLAHRWGEYVTPNNKFLFYSYGHGPQDCALYWVRFDNLLEDLRHSNFEPYVRDSIAPQRTKVNQLFSLPVSDHVFYDDDGNSTLSYSATSGDGSALPAWLVFDVKSKTLSGTPLRPGTYLIQITATDTAKAAAVCSFTIKVE